MMHQYFKYIFVIALIALPQSVLSQRQAYLAAPVDSNQIIHRTWYSLSYNERYEQADWVAYSLTSSEVDGLTPRKDSFKPDPLIITYTADDDDYSGSGYDRGHLIPAADMKMSELSMASSFYYSNMSPQHPSLNRGIWRSLETVVRNWAKDEGQVYVVTGPVLAKGVIKFIGDDEVGVPKYFYKVIYDPTIGNRKAIGFILENSDGNDLPLESYAVSVDSVESFTGLDFFYNINDVFEEPYESVVDVSLWDFNTTTTRSSNSSSVVTPTTRSNTQSKSVQSSSTGQCEYYNGRKIITGTRGGKYYINSNGNKTYVSGERRSRIVKRAC